MLRPFLLIGIGGSGGKTLRITRHELQRRLDEHGWQGRFPHGWRFLHIDVPSTADGDEPDLPAQLPQAEYAGLVTAGVNYRSIDAALIGGAGRTPVSDLVAGWRPEPSEVMVPVERGAGQFRALGRVLTLANLKLAKRKLDDALRDISGREVSAELQDLTRRLGGEPSSILDTPVAVIVSSIAGGSGAGAVLDVCDLLRTSAGVWGSESIGILYAPDVFDYLPPQRRRGVRPNALATLSELVAGYWNRSGPSSETGDLYGRQGVALSDTDRLGPRYPFLVGARNDFVTYRTQNDIYHAMGRSLASWVTSTELQDKLGAYVSGNWTATAIAVPDKLGLKTTDMETPFTAMGSARVGLGRDRFRDYAAERLARAAVERLVRRHEELRPRGDERASRLIAQEVADNAFGAFLVNSELAERGSDQNTILDAIRPNDRVDRLRHLKNSLFEAVTRDAPEKGLEVPEWRALISRGVKNVIDRQLDEFDVEHRERGRAWVQHIQQHLRSRAAATLAMEGYVVTAMLLRKLGDELRAVEIELEQEAGRMMRHGDNVEQVVEEALRRGGGEVLPKNHPQVAEAVNRGVAAIHYRSEARLRSLVVAMLPDLASNVILPLAEEIDRAGQMLDTQMSPRQGLPSQVSAWPDDDEVPNRLRPAANEFLIEPLEGYGTRLQELVSRTVEKDDPTGAFRAVIQRIILGAESLEDAAQVAVSQPAAWVPQRHELHAELSTPQRASYVVDISAEKILARATGWLTKPGTPAGNFVAEGLNGYLDPARVEPSDLQHRLHRFEALFNSAVDAAQPLVGINKSVLVAVHDRHDVATETFFSELPFSPGSPAGEAVQRVLQSRGKWNPDLMKSFIESDRASIDAFAVLTEPYEPVVFDSLMKPIANEWGDRSKSPDGREEFWRWRRARSLTEFVPMAPAVRRAMVRGWFSASMLGQIEFDGMSVRIFVPNPAGGSGSWHSFPNPLLADGIKASHDYLPLALESLPLAFVEVAVDAKIGPMAPYGRLRGVGTSGGGGLETYDSLNSELAAWISEGQLPSGAPEPPPAHAGKADDEWTARKEALLARVITLGRQYQGLWDVEERRDDPKVARAMELRHDISAALGDLAHVLREFEVAGAGGDDWN
jgi:SOS response regulatory protein OraA/RecX